MRFRFEKNSDETLAILDWLEENRIWYEVFSGSDADVPWNLRTSIAHDKARNFDHYGYYFYIAIYDSKEAMRFKLTWA